MSVPGSSPPVTRMLDRVRRRIVLERALARAALSGWTVSALILLVEITARFVALPDLRLALAAGLVLAPLLASLSCLWWRRPEAAEVARRTGALAGAESLFLSLSATGTRLGPLLLARAEARAGALVRVALGRLRLGRWSRSLALPGLLAVLLLLAPGRLSGTLAIAKLKRPSDLRESPP